MYGAFTEVNESGESSTKQKNFISQSKQNLLVNVSIQKE